MVSLLHVWRAADCLTARRSRALDLFLARFASPVPRVCPGSYSWRELRAEAEGAGFAGGERPASVIAELRARERERPGPAHPPTAQTMRRWFREGRSREAPPPPNPPSPNEP